MAGGVDARACPPEVHKGPCLEAAVAGVCHRRGYAPLVKERASVRPSTHPSASLCSASSSSLNQPKRADGEL